MLHKQVLNQPLKYGLNEVKVSLIYTIESKHKKNK